MEIYMLYNAVANMCVLFGLTAPAALFGGLIGGTSVWLGLFILQGFGVYAMAKNRNMEKRWLAFVPFVSLMYIGKLVGECNLFGQRVKRAGLYAMIAQIVTAVICALIIFAEIYLYVVEGTPEYDQWYTPYWPNLEGFSQVTYSFYYISDSILSIFQLIYEILMFILMMGLYRKYAPKNYTILAFLALFVPLSRYIVIFVLRNRQEIDFDAYMRARHEAYMRQREQYRNYPYNNPYNNPYNGQTPPRPTQEPEEPFEEFGGGKTDGNGEGNSEKSDDFFD